MTEMQDYQEAQRREGSFKTHKPRRILQLINDEKRTKNVEWMCIVEWIPSIRDNGLYPKESEVPYEEVKEHAPKLVVDFYERHMILV